MTSKTYDVAIIGGGPGGYVAGIRAGQLGLSAVVIEKEHLGGVCLNWGCIPSKALIHASNVVSELKEFADKGIKSKGVEVDAGQLMAWKDGIIKKQRTGIKGLLGSNKCDHLQGEARFKNANTLELSQNGSGPVSEIQFKNVIVATGASVIELPGMPFDNEVVGYAKHGVSYDPIPKELVIIGGGVIGSELGMVYAKLGSKVTIVEMAPAILPGTDPDLVRPVLKKMKKLGVEVMTEAKAKKLTRVGNRAEIEVEIGGQIKKLSADKVLVAVGFKPNTDRLNLGAAGVKTDAKGWITVDDRCRTNVKNVYAIGDVTGPPLLAHRASKMGEIAVEAVRGLPAAYDVRAMPLGVFTDPEIAQAGLTEQEAKQKGYDVAIGMFPLSALGKAAAMNASDGLIKVVIDRKTDVILGIGIAAYGACDLIAEACLAIEMGALAEDLALTVHAHPTMAEGLMEAAKAARGEAVHIINKAAREERRADRAQH